jgi:tRNA-Thr(GGU) m(6)t(6)A37 methyltransferase TsaA
MSEPGSTKRDQPRDYRDAVAVGESISLRPIGVVRSPYTERHGTPRQAQLDDAESPEVDAWIEIDPEQIPVEALGDLDGFDRIWVIAHLHLNPSWAPRVRPPRGNGPRRGIFSTRSPHHPNHIGLSACGLVRVEGHRIYLRDVDLIDGTPVLDIKPYVPYCDAFPESDAGWVDEVARGQRDDGAG